MNRENQPIIEDLLEEFPFFVARYDKAYRVLWANRAARQFASRQDRDIQRIFCYEIWGLAAPCDGCPMPSVVGSRKRADLALSGANQPGWLEGNGAWQLHLVPVRDDEDGIATILETACDISRMTEKEADLAALKSRLRDAQHLAHIGHWELLPQTGDLFWSEEIFRIFEIDPLSFGASYDAFLNATHPQDRDMVHKAYTESLKTRQPYSIEHRLLMDDGRIKYVQERCKTSYDRDGNPVKSIGTVQDITENKRIEAENKTLQEKILHAQKMESVGRLAGGVAHDFNNMLFVILGNLDLIMEDLARDDPNFFALKEIRSAAKRSADLTRQLLAFARQQPIRPKVLDLNEVIGNMIKMLTRLIGEDIDLVWIPGKNLERIKLDPTQIDQILVNLCVNARDAIPGNGNITIETHMASFSDSDCRHRPEFRPGVYVILQVSDDGIGMDKATQSRLFEPFFTTKKPDKGTGLGLATTYGIVKQNNGFITVYSEPGKGTTFRLYFSVYRGKAATFPTDTCADHIQGGSETILLVEDEPMILKYCARVLGNLGYRVHAAKSPGQALSIARRHGTEIDLLLTDVIMARMSGRDLAELLTREFPHIKTLYMSGYTANVIAHYGILDNGIMFLQKPFSTETLAKKVRETLATLN